MNFAFYSKMDEVIRNLKSKTNLKEALESALLLPPAGLINEAVLEILLKLSKHDQDLIDLCVKVLKRSALIVPRDIMLVALDSSDPIVGLALDNYLGQDYSSDETFLHMLLKIVAQGSIQNSIKSQAIFVSISQSQEYSSFYPQFKAKLRPGPSAIEEARVYSLVASLAILNPDSMISLDKLELTLFARDFNTNDILLALNMIEIFSSIAANTNGYEFLKTTGVLDKFTHLLLQEFEASLVVRAVIKFWGLLMFSNPEYCKDHPEVFAGLVKRSQDPLNTEHILVSIANIGSTGYGLEYLVVNLDLIQLLIENLTTSSKVHSLRALSCFLSNKNDRASELCFRLVKRISSTPVEYFLTLSKSTIEDIAIASLSCLKNIAAFNWGLVEIQASKYQILLDHSTHPGILRVNRID